MSHNETSPTERSRAMKTLTRTTANKLRRGMTFVMSKTECRVISVEKNDLNHMIVRFVWDIDGHSEDGFLVVPEDFPFDIT